MCRDGYGGEPTAECLADGTWHYGGECSRAVCGPPSHPSSGVDPPTCKELPPYVQATCALLTACMASRCAPAKALCLCPCSCMCCPLFQETSLCTTHRAAPLPRALLGVSGTTWEHATLLIADLLPSPLPMCTPCLAAPYMGNFAKCSAAFLTKETQQQCARPMAGSLEESALPLLTLWQPLW